MYRAIIIDDEKWVIKSLIATIKDQTWFEIVGEAYDGVSGLSLIRELNPDLVFADVRVPGMGGLELLQAVNDSDGLNPLFIIISGHAEFAYAQKAMFHNAIGYCLKPFSKSELMDSMQKAYERLEARPKPEPLPEVVSFDGFIPPAFTASNKMVQTMVDYTHAHFCEDISAQTLADLCSINSNYASLLFKNELGESYSTYITHLRIQYALHLLTQTDMAVAEISKKAGYRDYYYFAKVFKKITGATPTNYRAELSNFTGQTGGRDE